MISFHNHFQAITYPYGIASMLNIQYTDYPTFHATRQGMVIGENGGKIVTYDSPLKLNNGGSMDRLLPDF